MNSMPSAASAADDVLSARADERLAHAYEQIARADEQLARVTAQLSELENDGPRHPSVARSQQPSHGGALLRGLTGLVLAAGIGAAALAAQSPYGEPARLMIAQWAPRFLSTWLLQSGLPAAAAPQAVQPSVQLAAAEATPSQPVPSSQPPAQDVAPAQLPAELTQLLQTMAHDIAVVEQGIEQLKASQERMFADNARAIEQLRVNQEQLTRVAARPSEGKPFAGQDARAKPPPAAPRPAAVANATHKPAPTQPPPQARARPKPIQLRPDDR